MLKALAIARGTPFLNKTTQKGTVLYLALEEKRSEVKKHFREMGATGEEDIYIHAASAPADALEQIRAIANEKKLVLIIVDPLFRLTRIKDGNDYAQVTAALEPLLVLARQTGAHVQCVHHAGKGEREAGDSILGSTAIFAAVDSALIMKRSEHYRTLSSIQRYGEDLEETVLRFDLETRIVSLGESKEIEEERRMADAIIEFLESRQMAVEEKEVLSEVEGRGFTKKRALRRLVENSVVYRQRRSPEHEGNRGNPFLYALHLNWFTRSQDLTGSQDCVSYTGTMGPSNGKICLSPRKDSPLTRSQLLQHSQKESNSRDQVNTDREVF